MGTFVTCSYMAGCSECYIVTPSPSNLSFDRLVIQGNPVRFSIILVTIGNAVVEKDEQYLLFCIEVLLLRNEQIADKLIR